MMAELKVDGFRALWFNGIDRQPRLWSRNGIPLPGVAHIAERLTLMEEIAGEALVVDGEFLVGGALEATKRWCEREHKLGGEAGMYHAFDLMTFAEWRAGGSDVPLYARKARLAELVRATDERALAASTWRQSSRGKDEADSPISVIPDIWIFNADDAWAEARRVWSMGLEGCMLKVADAPYRRGRNGAWQKLKQRWN
jgi:ATP-dependent DNA ligase